MGWGPQLLGGGLKMGLEVLVPPSWPAWMRRASKSESSPTDTTSCFMIHQASVKQSSKSLTVYKYGMGSITTGGGGGGPKDGTRGPTTPSWPIRMRKARKSQSLLTDTTSCFMIHRAWQKQRSKFFTVYKYGRGSITIGGSKDGTWGQDYLPQADLHGWERQGILRVY